MAAKLTKQQEQRLYISKQATTEQELIAALEKEELFNSDLLFAQLGDNTFQVSKEEQKQIGKHIEDRKKLQDSKKRVHDEGVDGIVSTGNRVKALSHIQVGKEQINNYMKNVMKGIAFDEMIRNRFAQESPELSRLLSLSTNLAAELDRLYRTPNLSEKTRITLYNEMQQTKMYVDAHMKEMARGIYVERILAEKLRENIHDERLLRELLEMDEISNYRLELSHGEEGATQLDMLTADYQSLKDRLDTALQEEANDEEVQDNIKESKNENKKIFTRDEAIEYQKQAVEEELSNYQYTITHMKEIKKRVKEYKKQADRVSGHLREIEAEAKSGVVDYFGTILICYGSNNEEMAEKCAFLRKQMRENDVFYGRIYVDEYLKNHAKPVLTEEQEAELQRARDKYTTTINAYDQAFHISEQAERNAAKLERNIKEVEERGGQPLIHPSVKEDEIRARAERMLVRQHRPNTMRQIEDKLENFKKGKRYTFRGDLTNNYQSYMASYMEGLKTEENPPTLNEIEYQVEEFLKIFVNKGKFCMFVPKGVDDILTNTAEGVESDGVFKNSLETGFKGEWYNNMREDFTEAKYGKAFTTSTHDYEKYGFLDDMKGIMNNDNTSSVYGEVRYVMKKDKMKNRTTFTFGDSLVNATTSQPSKVMRPSLASIPESARDTIIKYAREYHRYKHASEEEKKNLRNLENVDIASLIATCVKNNKDEKRPTFGGAYLELQYHGELTTDDVDEVIYYVNYNQWDKIEGREGYKDITKFLEEKQNAINAWKKKNVQVKIMLPYTELNAKGKQRYKRSEFNITNADISSIIALKNQTNSVTERNNLAAGMLAEFRGETKRLN